MDQLVLLSTDCPIEPGRSLVCAARAINVRGARYSTRAINPGSKRMCLALLGLTQQYSTI